MVPSDSRGSSEEEKPSIPFSNLRVEPFRPTQDVESFDCDDRDLNEFLTKDQVSRYEAEGLGSTYLVYLQSEGRLVAYFTVCTDTLRVEYLRTVKSFKPLSGIKLESIPSVKIGRLAVDKRYWGRDIGTHLLHYIAGMVMETGIAARLLTLQATPRSVGFYQRMGFELTTETKRERGRDNRTMFFDLWGHPEHGHAPSKE